MINYVIYGYDVSNLVNSSIMNEWKWTEEGRRYLNKHNPGYIGIWYYDDSIYVGYCVWSSVDNHDRRFNINEFCDKPMEDWIVFDDLYKNGIIKEEISNTPEIICFTETEHE